MAATEKKKAQDRARMQRIRSGQKLRMEKLEAENERLAKAWHNLHSRMVKDRADHEEYFAKSQARMLELKGGQ